MKSLAINRNNNILFILVFSCIQLIAFYLIINGRLQQIGILLFLVFIIVGAIRLPLTTITCLFITGIVRQIFQMTRIVPEDFTVIGFGLRAEDVILLAMAGAVFIKIFIHISSKNYTENSNKIKMKFVVTIFSLWIFYEIIRNFDNYGISAFGEFRYRYLILIVPFYIVLFFNTYQKRSRLFNLLIICSIIIPLLCFPIIGMLKGWGVGSGNRFFPSNITLGMIYGLTALFISKKYKYFAINKISFIVIAVSVLFLFVVDSHRSVWLSSLTIILLLSLYREIQINNIWSFLLLVVIAGYFVAIAFQETGLNPVEYNLNRGLEIIHPEEVQGTGDWRLTLWKAHINRTIRLAPIKGFGFGGYWEIYVPEFRKKATVFPHSLYVQTFVKLGFIGLLLYLIIIKKLFSYLRFSIKSENKSRPEYPLIFTSFVILIAAHIYYLAYAFDYYSLIYIGLGFSAIFHMRKTKFNNGPEKYLYHNTGA